MGPSNCGIIGIRLRFLHAINEVRVISQGPKGRKNGYNNDQTKNNIKIFLYATMSNKSKKAR